MRLTLVNLTSGGSSGGYRKYLERMLPLLRSSSAISNLDVLSPEGFDVPRDSADNYWSWPENDGLGGYRALKAEIVRRRADVVFVPTARVVRTPRPTVVMVRNMEPLVAPFAGNSPRDGLRNVARRLAARKSCRRATRVIAVSPFVRDFLVEHWRVPAKKVGVVPHGVERPLAPSCWTRPAAMRALEGRPMIFCAGSIRPARGLEDLFHALVLLRASGLDPTVLIAGDVSGDGQKYRGRMQCKLDADRNADSVIWAGSLSTNEMAWCYGNCSAFVMTSRVEACPNTALEALAYQSQCIATTNRPMPETFEDAAIYYEAGNSQMLADQISTVLGRSDAVRALFSQRAAARAADFAWESAAEQTIHQLSLAAKGSETE